MKLAVTGVGHGTILVHSEKTRAIDRDVERIVRRCNVALGKLLLNGRKVYTNTNLTGTRAGQRRRIDIPEMGYGRLVTDGARIGDIVAGRINCLGCAIQTTECLLECHFLTPHRIC